MEDFKEKYKNELQVGDVNSFQGFEEIFMEMNEQLEKFGCLALRDDYHAYDTLPGPMSQKGKLYLIGEAFREANLRRTSRRPSLDLLR